MIDGRHAAKTGVVIVENESITNLDGARHDPFETSFVSPSDQSVEDSLKWTVSPTRASRGRFVFWKDPHTKATDTVDGVVHESTELLSKRAEVRIRSERRSIWSAKQSVPVTEVSTASDSIVFHDVVRIGDLGRRGHSRSGTVLSTTSYPERGRSHVFVEQAGARSHENSEIATKDVADFHTVFQEHRSTPRLDGHSRVKSMILTYITLWMTLFSTVTK